MLGRLAVVLALSAISFTILAAGAEAQCPDGRIATPEGQCCWPGQVFSAAVGRCSGAPQCPPGLAVSGEECVSPGGSNVMVVEQTAPPPPPPDGTAQGQAPPPPPGYGPAAYGYAPPQPQPQMETVSRPRWGMAITGFVVFGVSYISAALFAGVPGLETMAIPIGGPWATMADDAFYYYDYFLLTLNGLAQIAGVTLAVLGLILKKEVTRPVRADLGNGRSISLAPWVVPGERGGAGLQLAAEF